MLNKGKYYKFVTLKAGIEVSRTPKGHPEQLAIVLTYQCKLFLNILRIIAYYTKY